MGTYPSLNAVTWQPTGPWDGAWKQGVEGSTGIRYSEERSSVRTRSGDFELMTPIYYTQLESPVGNLLLTLEDEQLTNICMSNQKRTVKVQPDWVQSDRHFRTVARQLEDYFRGKRRTFEIPMRPQGTDFQMAVWRQLSRIPYGQTATYGDIAKRIDNPRAVRAVGLANGRNPLPIVIPCHRVIGANGQLTGFGGGLKNKALLLQIEQSL